jgi:hypothetical protein
MRGRETYLVERIDRSREAPAAKAARASRAMFLRMTARRSVAGLLADLEDPEERAAILGDLIDIAAEHRFPIIGRVETATALNKVAADVCAVFRLPRAIKSAAAEHAFARLTAANDRGEA